MWHPRLRPLAAGLMFTLCMPAQALVMNVDFESVTPQSDLNSLTVSDSVLQIDILNNEKFRVYDFGPEEGNALQVLSPFASDNQFVINFSMAISSFTIEFGDDGQDADTGTLRAYTDVDLGGILVGSDTATLPNTQPDSVFTANTMTVSGTGIRSVVFDATGLNLSGATGQTVWRDDFQITYSVPEPTTFGLLAVGLLGLGFIRRPRSA